MGLSFLKNTYTQICNENYVINHLPSDISNIEAFYAVQRLSVVL